MAFKILTVEQTNEVLEENTRVISGQGKYPWYQLEVGQSFHVPRNQATRENYRPAPPLKLKAAGRKFTTRTLAVNKYNNGTIGTLVTRIA